MPTVVVLLLAVAWHSSTNVAEGVRWGILASFFAGISPLLYILRGVRLKSTDSNFDCDVSYIGLKK